MSIPRFTGRGQQKLAEQKVICDMLIGRGIDPAVATAVAVCLSRGARLSFLRGQHRPAPRIQDVDALVHVAQEVARLQTHQLSQTRWRAVVAAIKHALDPFCREGK